MACTEWLRLVDWDRRQLTVTQRLVGLTEKDRRRLSPSLRQKAFSCSSAGSVTPPDTAEAVSEAEERSRQLCGGTGPPGWLNRKDAVKTEILWWSSASASSSPRLPLMRASGGWCPAPSAAVREGPQRSARSRERKPAVGEGALLELTRSAFSCTSRRWHVSLRSFSSRVASLVWKGNSSEQLLLRGPDVHATHGTG